MEKLSLTFTLYDGRTHMAPNLQRTQDQQQNDYKTVLFTLGNAWHQRNKQPDSVQEEPPNPVTQIGYINKYGGMYCGISIDPYKNGQKHLYLHTVLGSMDWKEGDHAIQNINLKKETPEQCRMVLNTINYKHKEALKNLFDNKETLGIKSKNIYTNFKGNFEKRQTIDMETGESTLIYSAWEAPVPVVYTLEKPMI